MGVDEMVKGIDYIKFLIWCFWQAFVVRSTCVYSKCVVELDRQHMIGSYLLTATVYLFPPWLTNVLAFRESYTNH